MAEYIEREAVIDYITRSPHIANYVKGAIVIEIEQIPAADVKPVVRGEWIIRRGNWTDEYECSLCHKVSKTYGNYCPWCGADMRGTDDGRTD